MIAFIALIAGAASWWILEYLLHRFVGHSKNSRAEFAREHRRHHALGDYFAPTSKKIAYAAPVILTVGVALSWLFGVRGAAFTVGLTGMYAAYETFHRRLHTHAPRGAFGRWARRHHFHHHFMNPASNHGVTTPIFDVVFATRDARAAIRVPIKLAMVWLLDPDTGDVKREFADDYRLIGRQG